MKIKSSCSWFLTLQLVILALALTFTVTSVSADTQKRELKIGWSGPLSGNSAVLGIDSARAVEMVIEAANADPDSAIRYTLITEDDAYSTQRSVSAYRKLTNLDNSRVLLFLTYGGLFAVSDQAARDEVVLIDPLDCNEEIAKLPAYTICITAMTENIGIMNAEEAIKLGQKRAAILYFEDHNYCVPGMQELILSTCMVMMS